MKKFLILLLSLTMIFSLCTLQCFAEADDGTEQTQTVISEEKAGVFDTVYREIIRHSDKILSAMAFIGSVILAFAYKKGLLPMLKGTLAKVSAKIAELKETVQKSTDTANESSKQAAEKLGTAQELMKILTDRLSRLEEELALTAEERKKNSEMRTILLAEIDMLYEIFMSSSLPVYQKDMVCERISKMKDSLSSEGINE